MTAKKGGVRENEVSVRVRWVHDTHIDPVTRLRAASAGARVGELQQRVTGVVDARVTFSGGPNDGQGVGTGFVEH